MLSWAWRGLIQNWPNVIQLVLKQFVFPLEAVDIWDVWAPGIFDKGIYA